MAKTRIKTIGHVWRENGTLSPNVIESRYCVLPQVTGPKRSCYPYWVLDYDYRNVSDYRLDGDRRWRPRPANRIHLYPPHSVYWERPNCGSKYTSSAWILFGGDMGGTLEKFVEPYGMAVFNDADAKAGELLKNAAETAQQDGEDAYWRVHAILAELLGMMTCAVHVDGEIWQISGQAGSGDDDAEFVSAAANILRRRLAEKITVDMLADELGISPSSLAHRYREITGTTPINTLINMRIEIAKTLLRRGYKLKYIAEHTGFSDEYHLAKTFKKITGQTPGQLKFK